MTQTRPCVSRQKKTKGYGRIPQDSFLAAQQHVQPHLDMAPTVHEIRRAVMARKRQIWRRCYELPAEYWKFTYGRSVPTRIPGISDGCVLKIGNRVAIRNLLRLLLKLVQLQQISTPQPSSQKPAQTAGEFYGCKRIPRVLAVNVERATSATRGPLPSQLRYLLAADKMAFVEISSMAS